MRFTKVARAPSVIPIAVVHHDKLGYVTIQSDRDKLYFYCESGYFESKLSEIVTSLSQVVEVTK